MLVLSDYLISHRSSVKDALIHINSTGSGVCFVVDDNRKLLGIATDGDLRRFIITQNNTECLIANAMNTQYFALKYTSAYEKIRSSFSDEISIIPLIDDDSVIVDIADRSRFHRIPVLEPVLCGNELQYVSECIETNWISSKGHFVQTFEDKFEELHTPYQALTTSSGTTALHLALVALGIGPGDEVIVPDLTFAATASAVFHSGASPVFCDVDPISWCISAEDILPLITPRTKAVIPVHLYGQIADMETICRIASQFNLFVIEDCAEAIGSSINSTPVGCFGDASTFSFFGNKTISTGEGGMVLFRDSTHYELARTLRDHGMSTNKRYWHNHIGFNYRLTNLQAALGVAQLERLPEILHNKSRIMSTYLNLLSDSVFIDRLPRLFHNSFHSNWLFTCILSSSIDRNAVIDSLSKHGIECRPVFYPLHTMPPFSKCQRSNNLSNSLDISARGISLPSSSNITDSNIASIVEILSRSFEIVSNQ